MKKITFLIFSLFLGFSSYAQVTALQNFENTYLKPMFPVVVGIVFIVGALVNLPNFFGENRDIKKGVINVLIYPGAVLLIAGIYAMVRTISL